MRSGGCCEQEAGSRRSVRSARSARAAAVAATDSPPPPPPGIADPIPEETTGSGLPQAHDRPAGDPMSEAFAKYNRNGDGMLDREEVRAMLLDCNFEIDDDYIAQVRTQTHFIISNMIFNN